MELKANQALMLVELGRARAVDVMDNMLDRLTGLCVRNAKDRRFHTVHEHAVWGEAIGHLMSEVTELPTVTLEQVAGWLEQAIERGGKGAPLLEELAAEAHRMIDGTDPNEAEED